MTPISLSQAAHLSRARRVDEICDHFETAWKTAASGSARPDIENYLSQVPEPEREALLRELIPLDCCYRRLYGESIETQNYQWLHPMLEESWLAELLATSSTRTVPQEKRSASENDFSSLPAPGSRLGDYELIAEIARGGMGIVYQARQVSLARLVALKMIREGRLASAEEVRRFRREAEAAAALEHPHIVPVYEVGEHEGRCYFSMKWIEGGSLADRMAALGSRPGADCRGIAQFVVAIAGAVHHAHQHGILHRDLKPANILLQKNTTTNNTNNTNKNQKEYKRELRTENHLIPDGSLSYSWFDFFPMVTDFGLAKRVAGEGVPTHSGLIVGTPSYMAPEQAAGSKGLTTAVDVWGLGAILYELLTGQAPFRGESTLEVLRQVQETEPLRPRSINAKVDRDLETICLKCLRKEPHERYGSAEALAEDLTRWLGSEPIRARPVSPRERLYKWAQRRPAVASLAAALTVMTLAALLLFSWHWYGVETARRDAEEQRRRAERLLLQYSLESALNFLDKGQIPRGMLELTNALERVNQAGFRPEETEELRRPILANLSAWYGRLCRLRNLLPHSASLHSAHFSPDGQRVVTLDTQGKLRIWESSGGLLSEWSVPRDVSILAAAFSPDARLLATGGADEIVRLWDIETGEIVRTLQAPSDEPIGIIRALAISSKGKVAAAGEDAVIGIWDIEGSKWIHSLRGHKYAVLTLTFAPSGAVLASGSEDRTVRLWDVTGQKELRTCVGSLMDGCSHHYAVRAVAFSPDGTKLVSGSEDHTAQIWNVENGKPMLWNDTANAPLVLTHQDAVQAVAFSTDGKQVLTGSFDRTAQLWDAATGRAIEPSLEHPGAVGTLAFGPDGVFLTAARDGTARIWSNSKERAWLYQLDLNDSVMAVALSPDGRLALTGSGRGAWLWSTETGGCVGSLESRGPDTGSGHQDDVWSVAFSPDGRSILTASRDGTVRMWDTETRQPCRDALQRPLVLELGQRGRSALYSPDGRHVLTGAGNSVGEEARGAAWLWDVGGRHPHGQPLEQREIVWQVAVSRDGRTAAIAAGEETAQLWDVRRRKPFGPSLSHQNRVVALDFSPDGSLLATGSTDKMARLWDTTTGAPIGYPFEHGGAVWGVAFADARTLVTSCRDGRVRLWDLPTRSLIGPPWSHQGIVWTVACHPASGTILTGSEDKTARLWRLPAPWENDVRRARLRVEVSTGLVLDTNGVVRWLDPTSWQQRYQALQGQIKSPES